MYAAHQFAVSQSLTVRSKLAEANSAPIGTERYRTDRVAVRGEPYEAVISGFRVPVLGPPANASLLTQSLSVVAERHRDRMVVVPRKRVNQFPALPVHTRTAPPLPPRG